MPAARERMILSNLRLVVTIAHDYVDLGLSLLDLISEGNIGLTKAVERFDPTKGAKLSTYAAWWIKQSIKRALANQSKTIRLPVHLVDKIAKVRRVSLQMSDELGREPTDEELGEENRHRQRKGGKIEKSRYPAGFARRRSWRRGFSGVQRDDRRRGRGNAV
jgi:RNA polymerase primary sigma factor